MNTKPFRTESDSLGSIAVASDKLWGAQTERAIKYFKISDDLFPFEMLKAYAIIKKAAAIVNHRYQLLSEQQKTLIVQVCDEIIVGKHQEHFPLSVWMTGSGTQYNMNINEVIANRICQLLNLELGDKSVVHPNDHVNKSQSSNDTFPTAIYMVAAMEIKEELIPELQRFQFALQEKANAWASIIKIGRTHMQDATPITLGQEFSGYAELIADNIDSLNENIKKVYALPLGGTAVGTGINAPKGFDVAVVEEIARLTKFPFISATNKFAVQGSHDAIIQLSGTLKTIAVSLHKIVNDIRFLSCGPRCGIAELQLPENEPGSSIMPGKVNPTQCEVVAMLTIQVIANDLAVTLGGAGGHLEMNVYKPLIFSNMIKSIRLLQRGALHFRQFLIEGMQPNLKQIETHLNRSLMLVTALTPLIGYDKAAQVAHHALVHGITLKEASLQLGFITEEQFDTLVDPKKMIEPI